MSSEQCEHAELPVEDRGASEAQTAKMGNMFQRTSSCVVGPGDIMAHIHLHLNTTCGTRRLCRISRANVGKICKKYSKS